MFLYFWEPGGNRIEAFGDVGYLIFDPAWEPVTWREPDLVRGTNWYEGTMPQTFYTRATPTLEALAPKITAPTGQPAPDR